MEATYLSETLHMEINNNKKRSFDSFQEICMVHLYPASLNLCKNLMDYLNGLKIILLGIFSFHINILWKKTLNHSIIFVMFLWRIGNVVMMILCIILLSLTES